MYNHKKKDLMILALKEEQLFDEIAILAVMQLQRKPNY
jgi:hypothetical protein